MRLPIALLIIASLALGMVGCQSSSTGSPDPARLGISDAGSFALVGLSAEEAARARKLYRSKCARCHKFYPPADYSEAEWASWMGKMSKKARLKPDQEQILLRYLDSFRSSVSTSDPPAATPAPRPPANKRPD